MAEMYEINKTLCEGLDNKIDEKRREVLDTICKVGVEKRKITTFYDALGVLEKRGTKISGMSEKIIEELTQKWEKGEPIYIMGKKIDIPSKGKEEIVFEEIKCDINRIGEAKDTLEEIKMLKNTKELMKC